MLPRPPATPAPLAPQAPAPPSALRPPPPPPPSSALAQLEQRLLALQLEVRKLGSERHTLRARLRREADRRSELESALRAEKELRGQAAEEHQAALAELRARLAELEASRDAELTSLRRELESALRAAAEARANEAALRSARAPGEPARVGKAPQGLRQIRGIGPAYERVLHQLGVTEVAQIAAWSDADAHSFAQKLKIRPERIAKDDWIGQARELSSR